MSATDELRPWWQRHPERLSWELANFADLGLEARTERTGNGAPVIRTAVALSDGRRFEVIVSFPYEYPIAKPTVKVQAGLLGPPHEVGGLLCLFDNAPNQWHPGRAVAELVAGRVTALLEGLLVAGSLERELEEQIPEVNILDLVTEASRVVLVPDPFWGELPEGCAGGVIALCGEGDRRMLCYAEGFGASTDQAKRVGCDQGLDLGHWVDLPHRPLGYRTPAELLEMAHERLPGLLEPVGFGKVTPQPPQWVAVNFLGPGIRAGEHRRRWAFVKLSGPHTVPPAAQGTWQAQALTLAERQLRIPELGGLEQAKIALLGVGSLGSKVAIELAKAGCSKLVVVDSDSYDANNAVRHELAPIHAGARKAEAVGGAVEQMNPFCTAEPLSLDLGVGEGPTIEFLRAIEGANLLIETTGARAVTRLCERYGRIAGVPLLSASLTRGSRGGDMVLLRDGSCFECFLHAQESGAIPKPEQGEERAPVVPVGCAHPAFSGAGFDAAELSSAVARTAVRATGLTAYPELDYDWAVVNFVGDPRWRQGRLERDPSCRHRG
jgi:molybdopterin/thiamine biosynthesis adenylyltransferase